jgi:hypothetical protein
MSGAYGTPTDKFGRRWPELALPNHRVWLCSECGQPDVKNTCTHKKLNANVVRKLGGKV